jgi:hypothetical protein
MFCRPLRDKSRYKPHRHINSEFTFTEFEYAHLIPQKDWCQVINDEDIFFNTSYLSVIEKSSNSDLKCRYIIFYKNSKPCGIAYFQLIDFKASVFGELLQQEVEQLQSKRMQLFEKYIQTKEKEDVLLRLMTCGNNLISGEYGYKKTAEVEEELFVKLLCTVIKTLSAEDGLKVRLSAVLLKDFYKPVDFFEDKQNFKGLSFTVEPNMMIDLPEGLKKLDDYIAMFSKKYRNRAKAILKHREKIVFKTFDITNIQEQQQNINRLYVNIYGRAKFKLLMLPEQYFTEAKIIFGDKFFLKALFVDNTMVAFMSGFYLHNGTLEAHYIGMDYQANEANELYQNMLYEFIRTAIEKGCARINLGRTAAEIKSTVGAKAQDLVCYVQPQNTLSKLIVNPFIEFLKPKAWISRNPFKDGER